MNSNISAVVFERNHFLEKKAFQIVNIFIGDVTQDIFLENLNSITKKHYDDIIEERAISKMCAYPLCSNLLGPIPQQEFTIKTHTNKIYRLTERKKYCCDFCYEANLFVIKQIPESPLWWRENEPRPQFELLSPDKKIGLVGEELDITKLNIGGDEKKKEEKRAKRSQKKLYELNAIEEESICGSDDDDSDSADESDNVSDEDKQEICENDKKRDVKAPVPAPAAPIIPLIIDHDLQSKVEHVERCFKQWFTLESLLEIFNETVIKEKYADAILNNCAALKPGKKLENLKEICKKLGLADNANLLQHSRNDEFEKNLKKARFFFGVKTTETNTVAANEEEEETPIFFPLVDRVAQNSIRKNIFLQSLNSAIRTICPIFDVSSVELQNFLVALSKTFNLTAKNVTFNSKVTKYVGLLLLKVFAKKSVEIEELLNRQIDKQINVLNEIDKSLESCEKFLNNLFDFQ